MQKNTKSNNVITFFVAANGYTGFRSYFSSVFSPEKYERIFILKGGPGTGKSSLMRNVADALDGEEFYKERILCSSDPHSLDGLIIKKNGKIFAILDGTAPHTRDTELPGAVDEIVNLGNNWSFEALKAKREQICELNAKKKLNYSLAYTYLNKAGKVKELTTSLEKISINDKNLKSAAKSLAESLSREEPKGNIETRLISSFGRRGTFTLDTLEKIAEKTIKIKKTAFTSSIYFSALSDEIKKLGAQCIEFPNAFDGNITEALFFPESKTAITLTESPSADICPDEYVCKNPGIKVPESADILYNELLSESKRFFTFASDAHFELEKIYIKSMNFEANTQFCTEIVEKIKKATN